MTKAQKKIVNAFREQIRVKFINEIKVTDICKAADIHNSTFYKYYQDVYDLREQIDKHYLEEYKKKIVSKTPTEPAARIVDRLFANWTEYYLLRRENWGDDTLIINMVDNSHKAMLEYFEPYSDIDAVKVMLYYLVDGFQLTMMKLLLHDMINEKNIEVVKKCCMMLLKETIGYISPKATETDKRAFLDKIFGNDRSDGT